MWFDKKLVHYWYCNFKRNSCRPPEIFSYWPDPDIEKWSDILSMWTRSWQPVYSYFIQTSFIVLNPMAWVIAQDPHDSAVTKSLNLQFPMHTVLCKTNPSHSKIQSFTEHGVIIHIRNQLISVVSPDLRTETCMIVLAC